MRATHYFHAASGQYVTLGSGFALNGVRYSNVWLEMASESDLAAHGLAPVVTVETVPEDYQNYNRSEELVGAERRVTWTRKLQAEIDANTRANVQAQIDTIERETLMNRATREFMIALAEQQAAAAGYTPAQLYAVNLGYRKVKDIDNQIAALWAQIGEL